MTWGIFHQCTLEIYTIQRPHAEEINSVMHVYTQLTDEFALLITEVIRMENIGHNLSNIIKFYRRIKAPEAKTMTVNRS